MIVTGGTGGLGRQVVQRFLADGDLAVVPWISKPEREDAVRAWGDSVQSGRVTLIEADIATPEGARRIADAAPEVDVLINAAGGFIGGAPVYETSVDAWDQMFRINVRTAVSMTHAVLPGMLRLGHGAMACVASQAAYTRPAGNCVPLMSHIWAPARGWSTAIHGLSTNTSGSPRSTTLVSRYSMVSPRSRLLLSVKRDTKIWLRLLSARSKTRPA